mmetsp:Transcript_11161/g.34219  ORF Transcript_11161/g.34219 Transcript_11161/m.34219 type:complete len:336 (-) Transcript_11161:555-1562(-)
MSDWRSEDETTRLNILSSRHLSSFDRTHSKSPTLDAADLPPPTPLTLISDPQNPLLIFHCFLFVKGREHQVRIELNDADETALSVGSRDEVLPEGFIGEALNRAQLFFDDELSLLLRPQESTLRRRLRQSTSVQEFADELLILVERVYVEHVDQVGLPAVDYYRRILVDLEEIGWQSVTHICTDTLRTIDISLPDSSGRVHTLHLKLPVDYPASSPHCECALPSPFDPTWHSTSGLVDVVRQFEVTLQTYAQFWSEMENLDTRTLVLEPSAPTPADSCRRIALARHASVELEIDPLKPRHIPRCRLIGPERVVAPLRETLNRNLNKWDFAASRSF